jgi:N-acetylglucosaminyl-diphospho-decaprenol L-rhamnosyltransferase
VSTSILIVSYNTRELSVRCIGSLPPEAEVIVFDNASSDGSVAAIRSRFPAVRIIESPANRGFSVGVNRSASLASRDKLLILNPDTELAPGTLARMEAALDQSDPQVWAMGFRQVDAEGFFQLAVGPRPTLFAELLRRWVQRRLDRRNRLVARIIDGWLSRRRSVPWVAGSALLVRRDAFHRVNGFDERFFLFFEDIDFCLRIGAAGGWVVYEPGVTLIHHRGSSAKQAEASAQHAYRQSQLYFWEKHRSELARRLVALYQRASRAT